MNSHTPGKWEVRFDWDVTGYPCYFLQGIGGPAKWHEETLEANARLIAAAPEMKDELARRLEYLESLWLMLEDQPYMPKHQELLRLRKIFCNIEGTEHE